MQIHSTSLKIFISKLKNHQNLTFWPKKRISYGTGQKLTPEKSPGLETRFSHNKWTKTITIYNKKSALFGGALRKWHAWFFGSPIMGPGGQFLPKNDVRAVFRQKLATGAHDGWTKKSSMPNPPNNEEHDTFCSLFQIWSKLMYRTVDGELNIAFNKKIREILRKCWNNAFSRCPERITWWISSPRVLTFGILFFLS